VSYSGPGELLFEGESVASVVEASDAQVLVTSHRVLVLSAGDGPRLRSEYRPNVEGATVDTAGRTWLRDVGIRAVVAGLAALVAGSVLDLDFATDLSTPDGATGLGGVFSLVGGLLDALALLDDALLVGGALAALAGVALLGGYLATRRRQLVIAVAGGDDLRVTGSVSQSDATRLDEALAPE
jgi:hypothetical protein